MIEWRDSPQARIRGKLHTVQHQPDAALAAYRRTHDLWLKPRAGWLTLIPSHLTHDVVPSGTREPRIPTAADLTPIRD